MNPAIDQLIGDELISLAHCYGADPRFARAGGGNISAKQDGVLHIKPSGVAMADLAADDLVPLKLDVLLEALTSDVIVEGDPVRAAAAKAVIGNPTRRPSVEILFHALIEDQFVLHTHPPLVNALTCNTDAAELTRRLLGDDALFVPYVDPGVPLARAIAARREAHAARTGRPAPGVVLLGNHGLIVSGASAAEITERTDRLMAALQAALDSPPRLYGRGRDCDTSGEDPRVAGINVPESAVPDERDAVPGRRSGAGLDESAAADITAVVNVVAPTLRGLLATGGRLPVVASDTSVFVREATLSPSGQAVLAAPLIPDQIVYAGACPAVVDVTAVDLAAATTTAVDAYRDQHGHDPIVTVVPGIGAFAAGIGPEAAGVALAMFTDALQVAHDADRLGHLRVMTAAETEFIENWEGEAYRKQVAAKARAGRLDSKIVLVTGAAQGFGLGIAEGVIAEGATVVLADLNYPLAAQHADRLSAEHGAGRAWAVAVDVSDESSQLAAVAAVVARYGGLDVFISNAGVLRAGSVMTQPVDEFDLVTAVNYRGYFLGVRAVAPVLAAQHVACPDAWFDIIEINSKSGLEGSKRNFAYSGSKFGGIGLTQSFALELVEAGIKVNAVCPGNYLDGPLWTDPERGLFVQYLRQGKVVGATSVGDVRAYYESKVPMGRGCRPADLVRAILYLVEQQYETGQAVPVTGGQNMLN